MDNPIKMMWDIFALVIILMLTLTIPWAIAFPDDSSNTLDAIVLAVFIADLLMTFCTSYLDENGNGDEIIDGRMIFKNYFRSADFWVDLISSIPINEIYTGSNKSVIRILFNINIHNLDRYLSVLGWPAWGSF
jgi:hypothetical protein